MNFSTAELYDLLMGLYSYDSGYTNGINNESLRALVIDDLTNMEANNFRIIMSRFVREYFLSENALFIEDQGIFDASLFIDWLRGPIMGIEL